MKPDRLGIVQFIHPGKEQTAVRNGFCPWNSAVRSDKAWPHRRKFFACRARYVAQDATEEHEGVVGFWGEWEAPSLAKRLPPAPRGYPTYCHLPALYAPGSYRGLLDTDPFVFGERFLYCGCQQHTAHNRPGGAVETFLRRLAVGSLILFGSSVDDRFVLDTALVVGDCTDYPNGVFDGLAGKVPAAYYPISLHTQFDGNKSCDSFRLYRGAPFEQPLGGMFSFTPCVPWDGRGFARPRIALPGIVTQSLKQGKKFTPAESVHDVEAAWQAVRAQVLQAGLFTAHRVALEPRRIFHDGATEAGRRAAAHQADGRLPGDPLAGQGEGVHAEHAGVPGGPAAT